MSIIGLSRTPLNRLRPVPRVCAPLNGGCGTTLTTVPQISVQNNCRHTPLPLVIKLGQFRHAPGIAKARAVNHGETLPPERIKMARARAIVGLDERVMQLMAEAGEIPGAIKIRGVWTFDETRLRNWVAELEAEQCESRKRAAAARPRRTRNGVATRSTVVSGSRANSSDGRYEQAMSSLLAKSSRRTSRG